MRERSIDSDLEVYAVAGTHTAVLSFDCKQKPLGCLGFALERKDIATGKRHWLEGQKCFRSLVPDPVRGQKYPTHLHPIQGFLWKDFTLTPGQSYTYRVTPVGGTPAQLTHGTPTEVTVTAEKERDGKHGVYFNSGVAGSQAYAELFPPKKIADLDAATRERALRWLSRGLFEGLESFVNSAKAGEALYGAFYEFHEPRTLALLHAARTRGVKVQLVVDGQQYGDDNRAAVKKAGIASLVKAWRTKAKIPHNKFLVLCGKSGAARTVWTGSTNISEKGLFGQCNTGHLVKHATIAARYLQYWRALRQDPERDALRATVMQLQPDVDAAALPVDAVTVFFSPRSSKRMLDVYAELVAGATEMACGIFPFNVDKRFRRAFDQQRDFPRYIIVDRASDAFQPNDRDLDIATGAYIKNPIDQWVRERSAAGLFYHGTDFVHNKLLIVDPLGAVPCIVVGSANFSEPSTDANDENLLVLKGAKFRREADIYLTEFIRLFDHFNFRRWLASPAADFQPFLEEAPAANGRSWIDKYFDNPAFLSWKRKMAFKRMVVP